ncbi:MAG: hypothetical protein K2O36_01525, partial [Ruminococcus sp.]|nr:hypothetical protein [Ruminococcus sp.]
MNPMKRKITVCGEWRNIMKLFDNIKDFFFASEDDDEPAAETPVHHPDARSERAAASAAAYNQNLEQQNDEPVASDGRRNKVVNIQTTAQLQVVLVKPSAFTDAKQIADHLIAKKTVV